ncbi:hypothetical protein EA187_19455 [Lujinxingia sediminis]|uniref:SMP-30/Gluconolactonase/LRE-like region domain-containing protein n=1 Tax=Lujinxingia sediminis TaxID=2480984 RepID=A0ABY0CP99_9DELT|nr:hypothetical protein EA187_19455 [Lujinxingia sediminis]
MRRNMLALSLLWLVACGDGGNDPADGAAEVDRGPSVLHVDGDPNGLWWDDAEQALYIADDNGNRILRWTDRDGFSRVADLPSASPDGPGLGQLVRLEDGTFVVTRFGSGTAGDIVFVSPDGEGRVVPGLDPQRRRIGLTVTRDGQLYSSWFVRLSSGERVGAVGALELEGAESEVITGLSKPAGVLAIGDDLYVSDQGLGQILATTLSEPQSYTVLAEVEKPDLIARGPGNSIVSGSVGGNLVRIEMDGSTSVVQSGFQQVRGVAYDPTNRRAFVADHDPDESDGVTHLLQIVPMED